jgi:hypothetical protein
MEHVLRIESLLRASSLFHTMEDVSTQNHLVITSLSGHAVGLSYVIMTDEIVLDYDLVLQPTYVNLYTLGKLCDLATNLGVSVQSPRPTEMRTTKVGLRRRVSPVLLQTLQDVESAINIFCFAVDSASEYFQRVAVSHTLPNVDISMWEGVDLNFTNIDRLTERKAITYTDWRALAETVAELDIPDEYIEGMVDIANRCQLFEEANPHLPIAQVVDPLLALLEEMDERPPPNSYDVN